MKRSLFLILFVCLLFVSLQACSGAEQYPRHPESQSYSAHIRLDERSKLISSHSHVNIFAVLGFALLFGLFMMQSLMFLVFDIFRGTWYLSIISFFFSLVFLSRLKLSKIYPHGHILLEKLNQMQAKVGLGEFFTRFYLFCFINASGRVVGNSKGLLGFVSYVFGNMICILLVLKFWWLVFVLPLLFSFLTISGISGNTASIIHFGETMKGSNTPNATIDSIIYSKN